MIVLALVYRLWRWWPKLRALVGITAVAARAVAAGGVVAGGVVGSVVVAVARRGAKSRGAATGTGIGHPGSPAHPSARTAAADAPQGTGESPLTASAADTSPRP